MNKHNLELSDAEIDILIRLIEFGQTQIQKEMKKLSATDFDLKEYFWYYRYNGNRIKSILKKKRGY